MTRNLFFPVITLILVLSFALLFFISPNALVLLTSLNYTEFSLQNKYYLENITNNFKQITQPFYLSVYFRSINIGLVTLICTLIVSYPFSCAIYFIKNKHLKRLLLFSIILPFWTSSLIRTFCLSSLLKAKGALNNFLIFTGIIDQPLDLIYNISAIIFGYTYTLTPFVIMPVYLSFTKINKSIIEAAKDLGASNLQIFKSILLPLSFDGIIAGSTIVFLSSLSMFYISDILGGGKYILLSNLIKNKFFITNDWVLGCAISLVYYIIVIFFLFLQRKSLSLALPK